MTMIARKRCTVKPARAASIPSVPDDAAYESWSRSLAVPFEPSPEDLASLREASAFELDLETYLRDQATCYRADATVRARDLAAYLDRAIELVALTGAPTLAELVDRLETMESLCREREYERGLADGLRGSISVR